MSKVRVHNLIVSLDGFATGERQSFDSPFGHAQDLMTRWFSRARIWRGMQDEVSGITADEAIADTWGQGIGGRDHGPRQVRSLARPLDRRAVEGLVGRESAIPLSLFHPHLLPPQAHRDAGRDHLPLHRRDPGRSAQARPRSRPRLGRADRRRPWTIRDFLAADLVDHLRVVLVPILLGRGVRLWDGLEGLE
jgi:hypothetical protein